MSIKATHSVEGKSQSGSLETEFEAEGFKPGCDPNTKPKFDITKGDQLLEGDEE